MPGFMPGNLRERMANLRALRCTYISNGVQLYGYGAYDSIRSAGPRGECILASIFAWIGVFPFGDGCGVFHGIDRVSVSPDEFHRIDHGASCNTLLFRVAGESMVGVLTSLPAVVALSVQRNGCHARVFRRPSSGTGAALGCVG